MTRILACVLLALALASAGCKNFDSELFHASEAGDVPDFLGGSPPKGKNW